MKKFNTTTLMAFGLGFVLTLGGMVASAQNSSNSDVRPSMMNGSTNADANSMNAQSNNTQSNNSMTNGTGSGSGTGTGTGTGTGANSY